jgi:hypothetical protein
VASVAYLGELGHDVTCLTGGGAPVDPAALRGTIENFVGMAQIPVGLIGPLRINGLHAHGDFYVPLVTTEGTLVASYHRGARLVSRAGGVSALTTAEQVQRAPGFTFESIADAARFAMWAIGEFDTMRAVAATRTRHGSLQDVQVHIETRTVYLILHYHTGDAAGQNRVTLCTDAVCADLMSRTPVEPKHWFLESNMSGDKHAVKTCGEDMRWGACGDSALIRPRRDFGIHCTVTGIAHCTVTGIAHCTVTGIALSPVLLARHVSGDPSDVRQIETPAGRVQPENGHRDTAAFVRGSPSGS